MRIAHCLLWLCLPLSGFCQDSNSLLWEISGNGLQQPSYLYGTMHVSKKIAFLLDDVFYEALDKSAVVALESDPATWLGNDTDDSGSGHGFNAKGFYSQAFALQSPDRKDLASFLASDDRLVNNILYRTNEYSQNFEEETYLDMFIYQAGSKFGKPILALEDLEESQALVGRASLNAMKRKPDEWLQEKMQQNDLMSLMQDAYRERNIAMLDSIDRAMYTDHYLTNMLYIRNENMAHRLDSAIQKTQVFAGIGAAHLPGDKGVITLLQKKGYTLKPLVSEATANGSRLKEKFDESFRKPQLHAQAPEDGFFRISLPHKLYPVAEAQHITYISPDLTNGSYLMVHRVPTYSYLNAGTTYNRNDLEGLLFENIPGKILSKSRIEKQGFEGLDIRNQLKNGDQQRYQIYSTPLEVVIFKMGGQGDYVSRFSDEIFNSLQFKPLQGGKGSLSSTFRDFEVNFPSFYRFPNRGRNGNRRAEGINPATDSYYFLQEATLNDFDFIEQDSFELKQIQQRFYQRLKLQPVYDSPQASSLTSSAQFGISGEKTLYLKSLIRRGDYFLLGILTRDMDEAREYFNSFRLAEPEYGDAFRSIKDTALYFRTISPVAPKKFVESNIGHYKARMDDRPYQPYTKKTLYQHANNEAIVVTLNKSHDYMTFPSIDSVWALRKNQYAGSSFVIRDEHQERAADGCYEFQLTLCDTASSRGVLVKNVIKGGLLYELKAALDTVNKPSRFVKEFYSNFKPLDTLIGRDLMEDKTASFFEALRNNDSIVMKGYRYLLFDERHADSLMKYVATFDFSGDKEHIQSHFLKELGKMDLPRVQEFLRQFYAQSYNNSNAQTRILQAAAQQGGGHSAARLLELLAQDLPLVSNPFEIARIFAPYNDSLPLARSLYPKLLDYSQIAEYKEPIISMLASLVDAQQIKPSRYKKYLPTLLNDANMQLKRQLGTENQSRMQNGSFNKNNRQQRQLLEDYAHILFPYRDDKEVQVFFRRLYDVKDPGIATTYIALLAREKGYVPNGVIDSLAANINSRLLLFNKLLAVGEASLFPMQYANQRELAEASLFDDERYDSLVNTVEYVESRPIKYGEKHFTGYYFKCKSELDFNKNFKMVLLVFPTDTKLSTQPIYKSKGLRMADTETDQEVMDYVTEEFLLKDHPRAVVFEARENKKYGYGF